MAAGLATSGWPRQAAAARRIDNDDLLIFFDTLALMRRGPRGQSARPSHVRKWKAPVKVRTRGAGAVAHRATLEALLEETSTLTGVPFRRAIDVEPLDNLLTLYFLSAAEMDRLYGPDKNNVCYTNTRGRRGVLRPRRHPRRTRSPGARHPHLYKFEAALDRAAAGHSRCRRILRSQ